MATREEVARLAGVSGATVSRVFNNLSIVQEETRLRVLDAARQLGYYPNSNARRLATSCTKSLAIMVPYVSGVHIFYRHYFAEILSGIATVANARGYDMLVRFYPMDESARDSCMSILHEKKADGCLLFGTRINDPVIDALKQADIPFILINNVVNDEAVSFVDSDHKSGAKQAVEHLLNLGYKRICFVNGPLEYSNSRDREYGYISALAESDIPLDSSLVFFGRYSRTSGYRLVDTILSLSPVPDAIFAANDRMAFGIYQRLRELGLKIPEDFGLVGYDDSEIAMCTEPPLTTVKVPLYEIGYEAAIGVINRVEGKVIGPIRKFLNTDLVVRESTKKK